MADNYLEKKMEELRSGRLRTSSGTTPTPQKKGYVSFRFPPKRVLVYGGIEEPLRSIVRTFVKAGCRVTVADRDMAAGEDMAAREGIRFYHLSEAEGKGTKEAFFNVVEAWRDVDIVIAPSEDGVTLAEIWVSHKERFPIPSDYGGRLILFSSPGEDTKELKRGDGLRRWNITLNRIVLPIERKEAGGMTATVMYLSLPESGKISETTINME